MPIKPENRALYRKDDCFKCVHALEYAGNYHIGCNNPDPNMTGNKHGISKGWFMYPLLFDPVWKTRECANFQSIGGSEAVSEPVSGVV